MYRHLNKLVLAMVVLAVGLAILRPDAPPKSVAATAVPPSSSNCSYGSFAVGKWPGACWRPYAPTSPFNRTIAPNPRVHPRSAAIVRRVLGFGLPANLVAGDADTQWDYFHPVYWSWPGHPLYKIHCVEWWGTCELEGRQVRIPAAARAAGGSDHHITVIDQQSGWEYDLWQVRTKPATGGQLNVSWGGMTRIDGDGLGSNATAAHYGGAAGIIRAQEIEAGNIPHALFLVLRCSSGGRVYPAGGIGSRCPDVTDAPPMGTRFQLAMTDTQIAALKVPNWKKTILRAMARYGMYFGDTGGSGFNLQFESGSTYTSFGYEEAMLSVARRIGVPISGGKAVFNIRDGVDWARYLRVLEPCTAQGAC